MSLDNPFNHFLALGRTVLQLTVVTGDQTYVDRATKMARTLRNDLELDAGGAYVWPYWWSKGAVHKGWDLDDPASEYCPYLPARPTAEDTSHSQIDVNYALEACQAKLTLPGERAPVFTDSDMRRPAATFTQNIATTTADGTPTVRRYVDGSGEPGLLDVERQAAAWADLTPWDPAILEHLRAIYAARAFTPMPSLLYCLARLDHAANTPA